MKSHDVASLFKRTLLRQNEQNEAHAFDELADHFDKRQLRTSDWTFSRYRNATLGRPLFRSYPDLVFSYIGNHFPSVGKQEPTRPLRGIRVLDLGAGDGSWSAILAEQGAHVVSVEIAPKQVELAHERMKIHSLAWDARVASAYDLRSVFAKGSFDLVFGQGILHHLTFDLERVYSELSYVLKTGAYAVFTEPYSGSFFLRWIRERLAWLVPLDTESPDERPLTPGDLGTLRQCFPMVELYFSDLFTKFARRILRSRSIEISLDRVDRCLLQVKPMRCFAGIVFIAVRS